MRWFGLSLVRFRDARRFGPSSYPERHRTQVIWVVPATLSRIDVCQASLGLLRATFIVITTSSRRALCAYNEATEVAANLPNRQPLALHHRPPGQRTILPKRRTAVPLLATAMRSGIGGEAVVIPHGFGVYCLLRRLLFSLPLGSMR